MSYLKDLDDYTEEELKAELATRKQLRKAGKCDYCRRPNNTPPCKFPERHNPEPEQHNPK